MYRKTLSRKQLRIILERLVDEAERESEMTEFTRTKGGKAVMNAGKKIMSAGNMIREVGENHTGNMRKGLGRISEFVNKLGESLAGLDSLDEGMSASSTLPTIAELKLLHKEIKKLEK